MAAVAALGDVKVISETLAMVDAASREGFEWNEAQFDGGVGNA